MVTRRSVGSFGSPPYAHAREGMLPRENGRTARFPPGSRVVKTETDAASTTRPTAGWHADRRLRRRPRPHDLSVDSLRGYLQEGVTWEDLALGHFMFVRTLLKRLCGDPGHLPHAPAAGAGSLLRNGGVAPGLIDVPGAVAAVEVGAALGTLPPRRNRHRVASGSRGELAAHRAGKLTAASTERGAGCWGGCADRSAKEHARPRGT